MTSTLAVKNLLEALAAKPASSHLYFESMVEALRQVRSFPGLLIMSAVVGPWFLLVSIQTDGEFLRGFLGTHHLLRFLSPLEGHSNPSF